MKGVLKGAEGAVKEGGVPIYMLYLPKWAQCVRERQPPPSGGAKLALPPPIFEPETNFKKIKMAPFNLSHGGELGAYSSAAYFANTLRVPQNRQCSGGLTPGLSCGQMREEVWASACVVSRLGDSACAEKPIKAQFGLRGRLLLWCSPTGGCARHRSTPVCVGNRPRCVWRSFGFEAAFHSTPIHFFFS